METAQNQVQEIIDKEKLIQERLNNLISKTSAAMLGFKHAFDQTELALHGLIKYLRESKPKNTFLLKQWRNNKLNDRKPVIRRMMAYFKLLK